MPRKHLIASKTNKKQQDQSKLWQKLAREIKAAVKVGGKNVDANPRLKMAIDKALANNLSKESINKNINGNVNDENLFNIDFECYGPEGIQIIIHGLTNNVNRTTSNVRGYLSKLHGEISKPNSVRIFFDNFGYLVVLKKDGITYDQLLNDALEYGVFDIKEAEDGFEVITQPNDFEKIKRILLNKNYQIYDAEIKLIPQNKISSLSEDSKLRLDRFINSCEQDDDIQWVITNYDEEE